MTETVLQLGVKDAAEIEALLRELPSRCWEELARGPLPEPACRLCDTMTTLDYIGLLPEGDAAREAAIALLDYHEIQPAALDPIRLAFIMSGVRKTDVVHAFVGDLVGTLLYHRCQLIYEIAQRLALQED